MNGSEFLIGSRIHAELVEKRANEEKKWSLFTRRKLHIIRSPPLSSLSFCSLCLDQEKFLPERIITNVRYLIRDSPFFFFSCFAIVSIWHNWHAMGLWTSQSMGQWQSLEEKSIIIGLEIYSSSRHSFNDLLHRYQWRRWKRVRHQHLLFFRLVFIIEIFKVRNGSPSHT